MTTKFKKGDKVRVTKDRPYSAEVMKGDIGIHSGQSNHIVNFPGHASGSVWYIQDACLELVEEDESLSPPEPQPENAWQENTGSIPVPSGTLVDVQHRSGNEYFGVKAGNPFSEAEDWSLEDLSGDIIKWRIAAGEKISEKSVDGTLEMTVVLPHQDETEKEATKQEETKMVDFKVGDRVRVKASVTNPHHSWGQVKPGDVGVVTRPHSIMMQVDFPNQSGWNARPEEMELVTEEEKTMTSQAEVKLKPFCLDLDEVSAAQVNELLAMAVKLGARAVESVHDDELDDEEVSENYPTLAGTSKCNRDCWEYAGVDDDNDTYVLDDAESFDYNVLSYEDAKEMLEGLLAQKEPQTTKTVETKQGAKTMTKATLKAVYVKITDATPAAVINAAFDRLIALGVLLNDVAYDSVTTSGDVTTKYPERRGARCNLANFKLFGLTAYESTEQFLTYINDYPGEWSNGAEEMTLEEFNAYLDALEGKTVAKRKVPQLRQRKVQIVYTNDKGYLLKNVTGVDVKPQEGTVNITYKQRKGKVIHNNNVVIPFSELKSVKFVGPQSVGATYFFKGGKVVQVLQDFSHEEFTAKSH